MINLWYFKFIFYSVLPFNSPINFASASLDKVQNSPPEIFVRAVSCRDHIGHNLIVIKPWEAAEDILWHEWLAWTPLAHAAFKGSYPRTWNKAGVGKFNFCIPMKEILISRNIKNVIACVLEEHKSNLTV